MERQVGLFFDAVRSNRLQGRRKKQNLLSTFGQPRATE